MNSYPFPFHAFPLQKNGCADCPACKGAGTLSINTADPDNVRTVCAHGCQHEAIMDAAGYRSNALYHVERQELKAVEAVEAPAQPEEAPAPVPLTPETVTDLLKNLYGFPSFDMLAAIAKRNSDGRIPTVYDGAPVDEIAAVLGYAITPDRLSWYKRPQMANTLDLMGKTIAPHPFIVADLLPAGLCILSAPSKIGKSWLCLQLCDAVSRGVPLWGRKTMQGDTLYLDLEETEAQLQGRMRTQGCKGSARFFHQHSAPQMGAGLAEFLEEWCSAVQAPRLIVIDVVQRVKPVSKGRCNAYEADYLLFPPLNDFALKHGISIVAVTHNRKSTAAMGDDFEAITGSVAQMGAAAATWMITGKRGQGEEKRLKATGRYIQDADEVIRLHQNTCTWESMGSEADNAARAYAESPIRETLWQLLGEGGGSWYGTFEDLWEEIAERTKKYPFTTARDLAKGMRELYPLLEERDEIFHRKDKNRAKYHKFYVNAMGKE